LIQAAFYNYVPVFDCTQTQEKLEEYSI